MAKILNMPSSDVIGGFRGLLDFYMHCGQPCVRSWPRSPGRKRAPAVQEQWATFAFAGSFWNSLSLEIKEAYNLMAAGHPITGRDLFTQSFISGNIIRFSGA